MEPEARGDPECPLRWTSKATGNLADALVAVGHAVSPDTVGRLLRAMGYSLQATAKQREGPQHPDRDAQFVYLSKRVGDHVRSGDPVISVDTKKKELVGQRTNGGKEYQPKGKPERVGFVVVGDDHDTAAFAVATIGRWWDMVGSRAYPKAERLLIIADAGGSNGYRVRLWKLELAKLAARTGLAITVCHFPPGTSKWNKVEHRLWSHVSMNWRGRPLTSHEVIVELIGATTTKTGLKVRAELDPGYYPEGVKVTKAELEAVPLTKHEFHGDWNYTVRPTSPAHRQVNYNNVIVRRALIEAKSGLVLKEDQSQLSPTQCGERRRCLDSHAAEGWRSGTAGPSHVSYRPLWHVRWRRRPLRPGGP